MISLMREVRDESRVGTTRPFRWPVAGALFAVAALTATSLAVPGAASAAQVKLYMDFSDVPNDHTGDAPEEIAIAGGASGTFFIVVLNEVDTATNLHITNQVDSRLIVMGVSASPNVGSDIDASPQGIDWVVPSLGDESIIELTVTFRVAATADSGLIVNTATADADQTDPVHDSDDLQVVEEVGLSITKAFAQATVVAGSSGNTFEIVLANNGPSSADNVVVTDAMPSQLHVTTLVGTAGTAILTGGTITWTLEHLGAGDDAVLTVTYSVDPSVPGGTQVTNAASAGSDESSPVSSTDVVTVSPGETESASPTTPVNPPPSTPTTSPTDGATAGPGASVRPGRTAGASAVPSTAPGPVLGASASPSEPLATTGSTEPGLATAGPAAVLPGGSSAPASAGSPGFGVAGPGLWIAVVLAIGLATSLIGAAIVLARRSRSQA